ncbi:hypothetical protein ACIQMR_14850 [Streptomyces sp. NPDC091376]|uniref:hypothetical protein n=1 Tax=Streptomyces sp. NPDC091376 TaxID=3365994 RepID=UPI00381D529B
MHGDERATSAPGTDPAHSPTAHVLHALVSSHDAVTAATPATPRGIELQKG